LEEAALSAGVNLLCFVGGTRPDDESSNARHRVYELASAHCLDGIVLLTSTLVHCVGSIGLIRYCERYRRLPMCSIGIELADVPSVGVDNEAGMREAVSHLIRDHGLSRLASKSARLFVGYDRVGEKPWPEDEPFDRKTLIPKEWVHAGATGRSFVVMPLVWKQKNLGHVLLEFHMALSFAYEAVAEAISSALHGAELAARATAGAAEASA
jgi:hypothetical protein